MSKTGSSKCRSIRFHFLFAAALLLAIPRSAPAQTPPDNQGTENQLKTLSLAQLGDIEVTSVSKEPAQIWNTAAAIYVLSQDDIRRSGATTIPEILRLVPGVEVEQTDSDHWVVGIRGFGNQFSKSVLVLIDGRSVYTPLFEGVYWDVQNVLLEDIDRIEVIRGPGGTIWGANAVNGVINIITKSSKDTHGPLATVGGGNVDQGTGAAQYGSSTRGGLNYRIYEMGFDRGPEYHPDGQPFDQWRMGQAGFRTDWTDRSHDELTVQGDIYSGENGDRTGIAFFSPPSQKNLDTYSFVSGGDVLAHWKRNLGSGDDFQVTAYFARTNRQNLQLGETRNTFDIDFINHMALPGHQNFIWGLGVRVSPSYFIQTQPTVAFPPNRQTDSIYSGFLQDEIGIVPDKLSLTIGTKLEHNNFSGFEYEPSARVLWRISQHQSLWGAVTRAVRTPSRLDQDLQLTGFFSAAPPLPIFLEVAGSPSFRSERLIGYEAGYRTLITPKLYLDFAAFYNNYNDLESYGTPTIDIETSPYTYILIVIPYANGIRGDTTGGEIAPDWKVTSWWQLKGSYSLLQMHLGDRTGFTDTGTVTSYEGSSPHHEIVVQSLLSLPRHFEFDQTYRYVSALPAQSIGGYSTAEARLGWHLAEHIEFSIVGQNLLRPFHDEDANDAGPAVGIKRSVYAKVTLK